MQLIVYLHNDLCLPDLKITYNKVWKAEAGGHTPKVRTVQNTKN